ncbi:lytic murein transglycosylase [Chelatococcus sambhunathii]|uniref:Lytic murein transglycosylase n=1 Tax=Chelatococcus sambhunathii TaxID=363953 RepID=A0ABU1DJ05_9HYPH|nr:lytic murein transglycosylase [Chelatococcus sambhunathii]MDR4308111.1 lytic murein transglycosylase [Chelatococcus sambhunathii]
MPLTLRCAVAAALLAASAPHALAQPAPCGGDFAAWLDGVRAEARAAGVSDKAIAAGLDGVQVDQKVLQLDRGQSVFQQTFLQFAGRMAAPPRLPKAIKVLGEKRAMFDEIEQKYGVPGEVIVAFWGLETDFGANIGKFDTRNALATLSHDCRRPDFFRPQLIGALKIVDRGDLQPTEMRGAWAGELGQTQMMPVDYLRSGVDADGDGRVDLMKSVPDALNSAAKYVADLGWRRGEPWVQEVTLPADMPWQEADFDVKHPVSQWRQWGVKARTGDLAPDDAPAALLLPMGRKGPGFLAYRNFDVYRTWNQSYIYSLTAAYLATRIAGAPQVSEGAAPVKPLSPDELRELQKQFVKAGLLPEDEVDGKLGVDTRKATRKAQLKLGQPADGYPNIELLQAMTSGG